MPSKIKSTTILSESIDPTSGNPVTVREIVLVEGQQKIKQTITAYEDTKVDFVQDDGTIVHNVISEVENGDLYMTYTFEWRHPGASEVELAEFAKNESNMCKRAVHGSIKVMRELVTNGTI